MYGTKIRTDSYIIQQEPLRLRLQEDMLHQRQRQKSFRNYGISLIHIQTLLKIWECLFIRLLGMLNTDIQKTKALQKCGKKMEHQYSMTQIQWLPELAADMDIIGRNMQLVDLFHIQV
nr:MAG TPA: hypothetical protein [Caudoviricetes sp.]